MKQKNEVENLLSLIFQSGGQVVVKDDQLLVGPVKVAKRFGDQIRRLKPEIMLALGHTHCPICGRELVIETRQFIKIWAGDPKTGQHSFCLEPRHFDSWKFSEGEGK